MSEQMKYLAFKRNTDSPEVLMTYRNFKVKNFKVYFYIYKNYLLYLM